MKNNRLFPEKINRVQFLIRYITLFVALLIADITVAVSDKIQNPALKIALLAPGVLLLIFCLFYMFRAILFPRLKDVGLGRAYSLIIFVPIVNFIFLIFLIFARTDYCIKAQASAKENKNGA